MRTTIDGRWEMVRAELNGDPAPEMIVAKTVVELGHGRYVVRFAGEIADCGSFEITESAEVKQLVLRGAEGPNAGRTIPCLFQRMGDRLRICYGLSGVAPTEFATAAGQERYLATYRLQAK